MMNNYHSSAFYTWERCLVFLACHLSFIFKVLWGRSVLQYNADTYSRLYSITFEEVNFVSLDWT